MTAMQVGPETLAGLEAYIENVFVALDGQPQNAGGTPSWPLTGPMSFHDIERFGFHPIPEEAKPCMRSFITLSPVEEKGTDAVWLRQDGILITVGNEGRLLAAGKFTRSLPGCRRRIPRWVRTPFGQEEWFAPMFIHHPEDLLHVYEGIDAEQVDVRAIGRDPDEFVDLHADPDTKRNESVRIDFLDRTCEGVLVLPKSLVVPQALAFELRYVIELVAYGPHHDRRMVLEAPNEFQDLRILPLDRRGIVPIETRSFPFHRQIDHNVDTPFRSLVQTFQIGLRANGIATDIDKVIEANEIPSGHSLNTEWLSVARDHRAPLVLQNLPFHLLAVTPPQEPVPEVFAQSNDASDDESVQMDGKVRWKNASAGHRVDGKREEN